MIRPPSTTNSDPVANDDSSLARKTTKDATSSGVPGRPSGARTMSSGRYLVRRPDEARVD